jgi:hypothetical protein
MKKIFLSPLLVIVFLSTSAQIKNTRWKGTIKGDNPRNVIMDFKNDQVVIYTVFDSSIVETMNYVINENTFTVNKIDGQSDCDNKTPGKYSFTMEHGAMMVKLVNDPCDDRSSALNNTKWTKWKDHPEVKVDESILREYAGLYEFDPQHHLTITFEKGILFIEGPNNNLPKSPLVPESKTKFFLKIAGIELDFVKDASGKVIKFISHEEEDHDVKKIK